MARKIDNAVIESVSKILAEVVTGSDITTMFRILSYCDFDIVEKRPYNSTKWKRLNETTIHECNQAKSAQPFLKIIQHIMDPPKFVDNKEGWISIKTAINGKLLFYGLELADNGKITRTTAVRTINEAQKRLKSFTDKLESYNIHSEIFKYCTVELFDNNYFHAILEASKGIFDRVRTLSELSTDGVNLIEQAFSSKQPLVLIKDNMLDSLTDKSLYSGLRNLLLTIATLYRNPKAHNPKLYDDTSETDAITAFVMISLAHRILDTCINVRDLDN